MGVMRKIIVARADSFLQVYTKFHLECERWEGEVYIGCSVGMVTVDPQLKTSNSGKHCRQCTHAHSHHTHNQANLSPKCVNKNLDVVPHTPLF